MPSFSIGIMAHPQRAALVDALRATLGPVPVAWDTEGPATRGADRVWRTARRGWLLRDESAAWHVLLQDDAVPAHDLMHALPTILSNVPDPCVVSLYVGTGRPLPGIWKAATERADEIGAPWISAPRVMWGVALAVPTRLIPAMVAWCDRQHGIPDDMRVGRWARWQRLDVRYTWPSVVDHPDGRSITGHGLGRTSMRFTDDATRVDWDGPAVVWGQVRKATSPGW